jgi:hypothetical protein
MFYVSLGEPRKTLWKELLAFSIKNNDITFTCRKIILIEFGLLDNDKLLFFLITLVKNDDIVTVTININIID